MRESHELEARYFERMAKSLGDKIRLVEALPPVRADYAPRVLDVGAGGGELSHALAELGYDVVALDASDDAITRIRESFPEITTARMLANEAVNFGEASFDAVICSSILHEVFSYGDNIHGKGDYASLTEALTGFYSILKPGGVLAIRDGVKPDNWADDARVRVIDGTGTAALELYLTMCPFANGVIEGPMGSIIALERENEESNWFRGNFQSVYEFVMTYNWGFKSYPRETQELYGVLTENEYVETLTQLGFTVEKHASWYAKNFDQYLPQVFEIETAEGVNRWGNTNMIIVARKP